VRAVLRSRARACTDAGAGLHATRAARAVTDLPMPAMSPTMKEGGIAGWKLKEGDAFSAGDVLLEIVRVPARVL
jgi:hypothetical protein